MQAVTKEQRLDDECLNTLMCEVESIVNGRPITKLSDDPRDSEPLTPNHLLLLQSNSKMPPGIFSKDNNEEGTNGGARFNIWQTYSGGIGYTNICRHCKSDRNGANKGETCQLTTSC